MSVHLTMLNSMAGHEFAQSCAQHAAWGLRHLDLKDRIFGKAVAELALEDALRAARLVQEASLQVYCFSTGLFLAPIERGEAHFRDEHLARLAHTLELARILKPRFIRLLAAESEQRATFGNCATYVMDQAPWLLECYREAIGQIEAAGFETTIENEVRGSLFAHPREVRNFFDLLGSGKVCYTWDVQNMWQQGTYPSLDVYEELKPIMGYFHLKGGQQAEGSTALKWSTGLAEASWPVLEITRRVVADGISPVICLNPSHGERKAGYDYEKVVERDLAYLREHVTEIG